MEAVAMLQAESCTSQPLPLDFSLLMKSVDTCGSLNVPCDEGDPSSAGAKACVSRSMLITTTLCVPQDFWCSAIAAVPEHKFFPL